MAVYIVHAEGTERYKIGYAKCVDSRVNALKTSCPYPIKVITTFEGASMDDERALHDAYKSHRVHGEWFSLPKNIVNLLKFMKTNDISKLKAARFLLSKDLSCVFERSKVESIRDNMRVFLYGCGC